MTAFAPRPFASAFEKPTAQALLSDGAVTLSSTAFSPVGGAGTMAHPLAASAGLAPRSTAAPTMAPIPSLETSMKTPFDRAAATLRGTLQSVA